MDTITTTKIESDYAGNDQFSVEVNGNRVAIIRHIKRDNIRHYSRHMTASRTWVIEGKAGMHYATKKDAVASAVRYI